LIAVRDDQFENIGRFLEVAKRHAQEKTWTISCAVASGELSEIDGTDIAPNFEGVPAVLASRLLAAAPHASAIFSKKVGLEAARCGIGVVDAIVNGKHNEKFDAALCKGYFSPHP